MAKKKDKVKILSFRAENSMRLVFVEITPDGRLVIIGGENGSGKTSVLDTIWLTLGGARAIPDKPVRKGAKQSECELQLSNGMNVKRTITAKGRTTKLTVTGEDGHTYKSPQALLDSFAGSLSFDPLLFARTAGAAQLEILKDIAGLDFTELNAKRDKLYTERAEVNRDAVTAGSLRDGLEKFEDVADKAVVIDELTAEHRRRQDVNASKAQAQGELDSSVAGLKDAKRRLGEKNQHVEEWQKITDERIATIKKQLAEATEACKAQAQVLARGLQEAVTFTQEIEEYCTKRKPEVDAMPTEDENEVVQQIAAAGEMNRKISANLRREEAEARAAELRKKSAALTREIDKVDEKKARAIADAKLPVEGLAFDDDQVLLNGIPFSQASGAEQLTVSVAIGAAQNPDLGVMLIRDGSLLDEKNLKLLDELAEKYDLQPWVERVGDGPECQVVLEAGQVKE